MLRKRRGSGRKRKIIVFTMIGFLFLMCVGYAAFQTSLTITTKGNVKDTFNLYNKNGIVLLYDGVQNSETGHSDNANTWKDFSGNSNDGEIIDGTWDKNSLIYNGSSTGVFLDNKLSSLFNSSNTIEIRILFNEENARDIIVGNYVGDIKNASINYEKNSSQVGVGDGSRVWMLDGKTNITTDWKFPVNKVLTITYVYDKANNQVLQYLDGEYKNSTSVVEIPSHEWNGVYIGRDNRTGETVLNGNVYGVRVYSRMLTASEIKENYDIDKMHLK